MSFQNPYYITRSISRYVGSKNHLNSYNLRVIDRDKKLTLPIPLTSKLNKLPCPKNSLFILNKYLFFSIVILPSSVQNINLCSNLLKFTNLNYNYLRISLTCFFIHFSKILLIVYVKVIVL